MGWRILHKDAVAVAVGPDALKSGVVASEGASAVEGVMAPETVVFGAVSVHHLAMSRSLAIGPTSSVNASVFVALNAIEMAHAALPAAIVLAMDGRFPFAHAMLAIVRPLASVAADRRGIGATPMAVAVVPGAVIHVATDIGKDATAIPHATGKHANVSAIGICMGATATLGAVAPHTVIRFVRATLPEATAVLFAAEEITLVEIIAVGVLESSEAMVGAIDPITFVSVAGSASLNAVARLGTRKELTNVDFTVADQATLARGLAIVQASSVCAIVIDNYTMRFASLFFVPLHGVLTLCAAGSLHFVIGG